MYERVHQVEGCFYLLIMLGVLEGVSRFGIPVYESYIASAEAVVRIAFKESQLSIEPLGLRDVIAIEIRDVFSSCC